MGVKTYTASVASYFEQDGKVNLKDVLRLLHRARRRRSDLRPLTIVFLTGFGEGPIFATRMFKNDRPKMIAVTFPPTTRLADGRFHKMSEEAEAYLRAMKVDVISARLPFDGIGGGAVDHEMAAIKKVLGHFGRSMPLCVQAVLQACDMGLIQEGENVIAVTGDIAAVITASTTGNFLAETSTFCVREFICKPKQKNEGFPNTGKFQGGQSSSLRGTIIEGALTARSSSSEEDPE
jgi:hypothetical protein